MRTFALILIINWGKLGGCARKRKYCTLKIKRSADFENKTSEKQQPPNFPVVLISYYLLPTWSI
jgi:hypothetical protein